MRKGILGFAILAVALIMWESTGFMPFRVYKHTEKEAFAHKSPDERGIFFCGATVRLTGKNKR